MAWRSSACCDRQHDHSCLAHRNHDTRDRRCGLCVARGLRRRSRPATAPSRRHGRASAGEKHHGLGRIHGSYRACRVRRGARARQRLPAVGPLRRRRHGRRGRPAVRHRSAALSRRLGASGSRAHACTSAARARGQRSRPCRAPVSVASDFRGGARRAHAGAARGRSGARRRRSRGPRRGAQRRVHRSQGADRRADRPIARDARQPRQRRDRRLHAADDDRLRGPGVRLLHRRRAGIPEVLPVESRRHSPELARFRESGPHSARRRKGIPARGSHGFRREHARRGVRHDPSTRLVREHRRAADARDVRHGAATRARSLRSAAPTRRSDRRRSVGSVRLRRR